MVDERALDEKLAPQDFVADFVWAARALRRKPSVALVSIVVWCLPLLAFALIRPHSNRLVAVAGLCVVVFAVGWLGAEREFFRHRLEGRDVTLRELVACAPSFIGRFVKLALLIGIGAAPVRLVAYFVSAGFASAGMDRVAVATKHVSVIAIMVAVDIALTFVPSALVFTTSSAREAFRIGIGMIRQTWPRSGLYIFCPPLALNMLNAMYPNQRPLVMVATTAVFMVVALVAKGATAAFYLRERPVPGR